MEVSIDYILFLKFTRKIFTYAKTMDVLKSGSALHATVINEVPEIRRGAR
jgi:hypothetical protein